MDLALGFAEGLCQLVRKCTRTRVHTCAHTCIALVGHMDIQQMGNWQPEIRLGVNVKKKEVERDLTSALKGCVRVGGQ